MGGNGYIEKISGRNVEISTFFRISFHFMFLKLWDSSISVCFHSKKCILKLMKFCSNYFFEKSELCNHRKTSKTFLTFIFWKPVSIKGWKNTKTFLFETNQRFVIGNNEPQRKYSWEKHHELTQRGPEFMFAQIQHVSLQTIKIQDPSLWKSQTGNCGTRMRALSMINWTQLPCIIDSFNLVAKKKREVKP